MPMARALGLCRELRVVPPRMRHYAEASRRFFGILDRYSPLVEGLSLDEAFLDVTGMERLMGDGPRIGRRIKAAVRDELALVVSVGVAASKFVAKIASDLSKPDGLLVVPAGHERAFLDPLPVGRLWGVGRVTEEELRKIGLGTIGAVARTDPEVLVRRLGEASGSHLWQLARGLDERPVIPDRAPVSVGHEETFDEDLREREPLVRHLLDQADRVAHRVRLLGLRARAITLKIKYADHRRTTRRTTLDRATADQRTIGEVAVRLLARVEDVEARGVRLSGLSLLELVGADEPEQLELIAGASSTPASQRRPEALGEALDRISARFGEGTLRRAVHLESPEGRPPRRRR
jgi:DNA polymerase-4